jgi:hypothetical protein
MENTDVNIASQQVEFLQQMMGDPEYPQTRRMSLAILHE